jgi:hypothetical protein
MDCILVSSPNSNIETLASNVILFGGRRSEEVIKAKLKSSGGVLCQNG